MISVVTPNFNGEKWLDKCLESVASQTLTQEQIEMILIDDGSVDNSRDIIDTYRKNIKNLSTIWHEHTGLPGELRNIGIKKAIGRYVLFLDSDDYLENDSLEIMHKFTDDHQSDVIAFQLNGLNRNVPKSMLKKTVINADLVDSGIYKTLGTWKMCKRDFLIDNNIQFEKINRGEDVLFFTESLLRAKSISILGERPYYNVRGREDESSITQAEWNHDKRISVSKRMASLAIRWSQNTDIANLSTPEFF